MARPIKEKVDYFPHMVSSGKTLFILEQKFGNDGYAFWFKLLEILGDTKGHSFCAGNTVDWLFLLAKTKVTEGIAIEILETLSELEAIDQALWQEKIIWCQKFVDNISDVYGKRKQEIPQRPRSCSDKEESFRDENEEKNKTDISFRDRNDSIDGVFDTETPQRKVKESKGNNIKENNIKEIVHLDRAPKKNHPTPKEIEDHFEAVWKLYPSPKGKGKVSKTRKEALFKMGLEHISRCIARYKAYVEQQRANKGFDLHYQNGSTFFNSGYLDYTDDNYSTETPKAEVSEEAKRLAEELTR